VNARFKSDGNMGFMLVHAARKLRMKSLDAVSPQHTMKLPLSRRHLTAIHVNRVLRQLRELGLLTR
jgi:hypothetical protein